MTDPVADKERAKYEKIWTVPDYRKHSPGLRIAAQAYKKLGSPCENIQPNTPPSLLDYGCGSGKAAMFFKRKGFMVQGFDIAKNCLDPDADFPLITGCLWQRIPDGMLSDYGYCTDVLEHIPEDKVKKVLWNIVHLTQKRAFFTVAHFNDSAERWGLTGGERLHLTVKPIEWWLDQFRIVIKKYHERHNVIVDVLNHGGVENSASSFIMIGRAGNNGR